MRLLHKHVIKLVAYKWDVVAYCLGFSTPLKNLIKESGNGDPTKCCIKMFEEWLDTNAGIEPKTWGTLLEELDNTGDFKKSLQEIRDELEIEFAKVH